MSAVGFDLGSSTCFVAATRLGGIDTLDNDYSERSTPLCVAFTNTRRFTGLAARNQIMTNPRSTVGCFRNLIGLKFDDPMAQHEMKMFPCRYVKMDDGFVGVTVNYLGQEKVLSVIQLLGSIFSELLLTTTKKHLSIFDIAANVPVFFNDHQRRMVFSAARLADINLRCILDDTSATAVTYSLYNATVNLKSMDETRTICFIDVGFSCCQVSIVRYQGMKSTVLAANGINRFAGRDVDHLMANRFADEFLAKYKKDPRIHSKAWLKLLEESSNLKKKINSITNPLPISIECFYDDLDLYSKLGRDDLLEMLLEPRFKHPFDSSTDVSFLDGIKIMIFKTLEEAKIDASNINSVEIVGGSTRLVMVRQLIKQIFGKEPGTTLNSDESVSRGCTIMCAKYSPTIQIKPFEFTDLVFYDLRAVIQHLNSDNLISDDSPPKVIPLFSRSKTSPNVSQLTIKPISDFKFTLQQRSGTDIWVDCCSYHVLGVNPSALRTKLRVRQNESGICELISAQSEIIVAQSDQNEPQNGELNPLNPTEQPKTEQNDSQNVPEKESDPKKVNTSKIEVALLNFKLIEDISLKDQMDQYTLEEKSMIKQIQSEKERSNSKNNFEEFLYILRDKLDGDWVQYISEDGKENLKNIINQQEDWLYDDGEFQTKEVYNERLSQMQSLAIPVRDRYDYFENIPGVIDRVNSTIMHYKRIHNMAISKSDDYSHLPDESLNKLDSELESFLNFFTQFEIAAKNADRKIVDISKVISLQEVKSRYDQLINACEPIVAMPKPVEQPPNPDPTPQTESQPQQNVSQAE